MKSYTIWMEGYKVTGNSSPAQYIGTAEGHSFIEAVKHFSQLDDNKHGIKLDGDRPPSIWGCQLFDNEADARKSFG